MWVAPRAEHEPSAVSIRAEGQDLAADAVVQRFLPKGVVLPPGMVLGRASLNALLQVIYLLPEQYVQLRSAAAACRHH
jgi:hypothetical protein